MTEFEKDFIENKGKYIFELVKSLNFSGDNSYVYVVGYATHQYHQIKEEIMKGREF